MMIFSSLCHFALVFLPVQIYAAAVAFCHLQQSVPVLVIVISFSYLLPGTKMFQGIKSVVCFKMWGNELSH